MANRYKNAQFDLTTTDATDIYTVPSESRAIIQNIHTANAVSYTHLTLPTNREV